MKIQNSKQSYVNTNSSSSQMKPASPLKQKSPSFGNGYVFDLGNEYHPNLVAAKLQRLVEETTLGKKIINMGREILTYPIDSRNGLITPLSNPGKPVHISWFSAPFSGLHSKVHMTSSKDVPVLEACYREIGKASKDLPEEYIPALIDEHLTPLYESIGTVYKIDPSIPLENQIDLKTRRQDWIISPKQKVQRDSDIVRKALTLLTGSCK